MKQTIEFTIHGVIKGGKNNMKISRNGRHYPEKKWAAWRNQVVFELQEYLHSINFTKPLKGDLHFTADYYAGDLRRRDIPAMLDSIFHCIERAGVVENDSQFKTCLWLDRGVRRDNSGVWIKIENLH